MLQDPEMVPVNRAPGREKFAPVQTASYALFVGFRHLEFTSLFVLDVLTVGQAIALIRDGIQLP